MSPRPAGKRLLTDAGIGYWPRLTVREGRAIEQVLAGDSLFQQGLELQGAVVEATFAASESPLLGRLREDSVPYLIDPQSLRFASPSFLEVEKVRNLPFAPAGPLSADMGTDSLKDYVAAALRFQQTHGAAAYVAPQVPFECLDSDSDRINRRILLATAEANGRGDLEQRPLLALLAPSWSALRDPEPVARLFADLPVEGIYVQPTLLQPGRDSVEKLVAYGRLLRGLQEGLGIQRSLDASGPSVSSCRRLAPRATSIRASGRQRRSTWPSSYDRSRSRELGPRGAAVPAGCTSSLS